MTQNKNPYTFIQPFLEKNSVDIVVNFCERRSIGRGNCFLMIFMKNTREAKQQQNYTVTDFHNPDHPER